MTNYDIIIIATIINMDKNGFQSQTSKSLGYY